MPSAIVRSGLYITTFICMVFVFLILFNRQLPDFSLIWSAGHLQSFKIMFISIVLEAIPFILLGVAVSAFLQAFVSEQTIARLVPKNPLLGILYACVIGILFPICECGMIPIMRRLLRKGMPLYIAVVFIVAGPILNPIVFASTFMAFRSRPEIAYSRMGLAFVSAIVIGLIVYRFVKVNPLRAGISQAQPHAHIHAHNSEHAAGHIHASQPVYDHTLDHTHRHSHDQGQSHHHGSKWRSMLGHASDEFFEMGKYLIFGAMLAALVQTMMSRDWLVSVGTGEWSSHLFMMGFAYLISLCSTSDAFVASSFASTFSTGSILSFLVFGPMLDFKATIMLTAIFRARFVVIMSGLIFITVLTLSMLLERLL
jgi:uncharacterized membrane protein YraQ (UPF0718 family)